MTALGFRVSAFATSLVWFLSVNVALAQSIPTEGTIKRKQLSVLTIEEIKNEFIGNTLVHENLKTGATFPMYFDQGGTRTLKFKGKKMTTPWWFDDEHLCVESVRDKSKVCSNYYRDKNVYRFCDPRDTGLCLWEITVEEGNPNGL